MSEAKWLEQAVAIFEALETPGLHYIEVKHGSWCGMQFGLGECICNPSVALSSEDAFKQSIERMGNRAQRRAAARNARRRGAP